METNKIIQGDSLTILKTLPNESVSCVMTSPPYWALRDYKITDDVIWNGKEGCEHEFVDLVEVKKNQHRAGFSSRDDTASGKDLTQSRESEIKTSCCSKCGAWKGQLGLEPTFDLYIKHLCDIFDEVKRVLRKDGTCWVNLGDTYSGSGNGSGDTTSDERQHIKRSKFDDIYVGQKAGKTSLPDKSLCLIPFHFAIEMQNRGWILRNVIIWHKPNCMPCSVKDRFTVDFEYIFFFVKSKKYWFETQYEPLQESSINRANYGGTSEKTNAGIHGGMTLKTQHEVFRKIREGELQGRNKRTVWKITTKGFSESHFAVYPPELCETPIKAGCPKEICDKCGISREKIIESVGMPRDREKGKFIFKREFGEMSGKTLAEFKAQNPDKFLGYTSCSCNVSFHPGIVLDPFAGSGTTCLAAKQLGRQYLGIELNPEYVKLANERVNGFKRQDWKVKKTHKNLNEVVK